MIKICIYCEKWGSGGIESYLVNMLEQMSNRGFITDIVTATMTSDLYVSRLNKMGIRIIELSGSPYKITENRSRLHHIFQHEHYDVFYLNTFIAVSMIYLKDAEKYHIARRIVHSHNNCLRESITRPVKMFFHRISQQIYLKYATDYWACSMEAAEFLFGKDVGKSKQLKIIKNGIDTQKFRFNGNVRQKIREQLGISNQIVIGHIGRISYQKNQSFLLEVFRHVVKNRPEMVLLLIGDGDTTMLQRRAAELEIEHSVVFLEATNQVAQLLSAMDVFVFPSIFEGFGIVAIEAQCAGLPTICSSQVPSDVDITPLCQHLMLNDDISVWVSAITKALNNSVDSRDTYADRVKRAGYDIRDSAEWVSQQLLLSRVVNYM